MYRLYKGEGVVFGDHWQGPKTYTPAEWTLVATYEARDDSDGQSVEVYCAALPARFYKLEVLPGSDSLGGPLPGWVLETGSGMEEEAAQLAELIADGMLRAKV